MAENVEKLPGLENIISDGGLAVPPRNPLLNSSVLIIGFANNGPVNVPVSITDASKAFAQDEQSAIENNTLFGSRTNAAKLAESYYECAAANFGAAPDIRVMRLGLPTVTNDDTTARGDGRAIGYLLAGGTKAIRLIGRWAGTLYHQVNVTTTATSVKISYGSGASLQSTFYFAVYNSLADLVLAINADAIVSQFLIAELIEDSISALNTATSTVLAKHAGLGANFTRVDEVDVVQYIAPTITQGVGPGFHEQSLSSLAYLDATANAFSTNALKVGDGTYKAYTGDTTTYAGGTIFVPKYVQYDKTITTGVNNPYSVQKALGVGALSGEDTTWVTTLHMEADDSAHVANAAAPGAAQTNDGVTVDSRQLRSMFLGGIDVAAIDKVVSTEEGFAEVTTDPYLTTVSPHTVTSGIILSDEIATTDGDHFLSTNDTTGHTSLIVHCRTQGPIPGGFYIGVGLANDATTPTTPEVWVWDTTASPAAWSALTVTDETADFTYSGFIGITQTGLLAKIWESSLTTTGVVRFGITQQCSSTVATVGKINSIVPMVSQSYDAPIINGAGNDPKVLVNYFPTGTSAENNLDIALTRSSTFSAKPTAAAIDTMGTGAGKIYGNVALNSLWSPTIVTFKLPLSGTINTVRTTYTQEVATTSSYYSPNSANLIAYNSGLDADNVIQTAEALNGFGYETIGSFSSNMLTNGMPPVWGYAYVDIALTEENTDFSRVVNTNGVVDVTTIGDYIPYQWRIKYLESVVGGATIDDSGNSGQLGSKGSTGLNGFPGTDFSNMSISRKRAALGAALDLIEGYEADIYVLSQMYLDDTYTDETGTLLGAGYHTTLHNYLVKSINRNHESVGVISVKPFDKNTPSLTGVDRSKHFNYLTSAASGGNSAAGIMDAFNATFGCMTVVAGEPLFNTGFGTPGYPGTSEAAYAGLLAAIPVSESTTNKRIGGVSGMRYNFLREQQEGLMRDRFAVLGQKSASASVQVIDGVTAAKNNGQADRSDFVRISTVRVTFELLQAVRAAAEPYIGRPNAPWAHNQLKFDVQKVIDDFKDANLIVDGSARIKADLTDRVNGNVFIELVLVPPLEIRRIIVTTSLRPSLEQ